MSVFCRGYIQQLKNITYLHLTYKHFFYYFFYYYNIYKKAINIKVIMPIVLGNSNISYKETKDSVNPYNALLFKNQKVGIGVDIDSILNNSLEVSGNINIPSNSKYKINNTNFGYSNLDHKLLAGTNISIGADFKINNTYTLPTASSSVLGGVKVGNNLSIDANGILSAPAPIPYTLPTAPIEKTTFIATFSGNSPSTHEPIGTNERYMIFTTPDINYTFTVPTGGVNCDILLVGGGGGGAGENGGGGGGGGDVIYKTNVTLPAGNCVVFVGNGGSGTYAYGNPGGNGSTSSITSTNASFISLFAAGGGGGGGWYISPGTTPTAGSVGNGNYSSGGGGGSGGYPGTSGGTGNGVSGNGGNNGGTYLSAGGGGATGNGSNSSSTNGGNGGSGLSVSIIGTATTYGGGGGGGYYGYASGRRGGNGVDGGGNGLGQWSFSSSTVPAPTAGTPNRGGGGGGGGGEAPNVYGGANGGSGIVIIRYRSGPFNVNSTIDLIRGTSGDANRDFKIGNYNGDFIVKSSINGSDSDYIKMLGTNGAIYNFNNSLYWTQTSDRRIKENIEGASYDKCYENVDKLELNAFNYIKEFKTGNKDTRQLGFIAQEIKDIFPKSVFTNSYNSDELNIPDMHSIDIGQLNYTLYGAVKKLMEIKNDKDLRLKRLEDLLNIRGETHSNLIIDTIT